MVVKDSRKEGHFSRITTLLSSTDTWVADAENLLKQLKSSASRAQCEYAADAAYKLAMALQLNPQYAKELGYLYGVGEIIGPQEAYKYFRKSGYPSSTQCNYAKR